MIIPQSYDDWKSTEPDWNEWSEEAGLDDAKEDQEEREDRATNAIIAGILQGYTEEDWKTVFKNMDLEG